MKRNILAALLIAILGLMAAAQTGPRAPQVAASAPARKGAADLRQETFDIVWRTVKEKHFDPSFGGVDWDGVRKLYEPRLAAIKSDDELYDLLQRMLGELGQSHFQIIPPDAIAEDDPDKSSNGSTGIDLNFINGQAVITRVDAESPAAKAGLRPGFIIQQVDGIVVRRIAGRLAKGKLSPERVRLQIARAVLARINGAADSSARIRYLDERNRLRKVVLTREKFNGEMSPALGNFPPQRVRFESKRLADRIGYIGFNIFVVSLMDRIRAAIRSMSDAPGIIIDLRGNPGGLGNMSAGIAGLLETKQTSLGRIRMRAGYQNFAVFPQKDPYTGLVVIIIDGGSASTSEVFAAGMQENGRATVVGERSLGAVLVSIFQKLPTGALFQYAFGDYKTPKGVLIEGRGVVPDVEVKPDRRELLKGHDPQIDAAIRQIRRRSSAIVSVPSSEAEAFANFSTFGARQ
ncbi:MAG: S41 family peptidase [Blastocatellia bacterium]|nr:S41 family peptidase [Blastocatellia bacterium]